MERDTPDDNCEQGDSRSPIQSMAEDCNALSQKCVNRFAQSAPSSVAAGLHQFVEEFQGRFEAWASYLAVFAGQHSSLDHRVHRHPSLQDMIIRLLDTLRRNLFLLAAYEIPDSASLPVAANVDDEGDRIMTDSHISNFDVPCSGITEAITELNKLGIAIRSSTRSTATARARRFVSQNPTSCPITEFEDTAYQAIDYLYPSAPIWLKQQLASAMGDRYARLQYEAIRNITAIAQRNVIIESFETSADHGKEVGDESRRRERPIIQMPVSSIDTQALYSKLATRNVVASSKPKTLTVVAGRLKEPPLPKFEGSNPYTICQWCSQVIDRSLVHTKANGCLQWSNEGRRHYRRDLQPYVCIAKECSQSRPAYASSKEWLQHMKSSHSEYWQEKIHSERAWTCAASHDNNSLYIFPSQEELEEHVSIQHPGGGSTMVPETAPNDVDDSPAPPTRRPVSCCPLCLFPPEEPKATYNKSADVPMGMPQDDERSDPVTSWSMGSHIAEHLHHLMVISLQLISTANLPPEDKDRTDGVSSKPGTSDSDPADDNSRSKWENRLDELPNDIQGPVMWPENDRESTPDFGESSEPDWSAAQHDGILKDQVEILAAYQPYDHQNVVNEFPALDGELVARLGNANTKRRAIFKYRQLRHEKMVAHLKANSQEGHSPTFSDTEPIDLHTSEGVVNGMEEVRHARWFKPPLFTAGNIIPLLAAADYGGLFLCPCCHQLTEIGDEKKPWITHVFEDLRPYICIFPRCNTPDKLYGNRREWFSHMNDAHGLDRNHVNTCILCQTAVIFSPMEIHLGQHLEQLALFALCDPKVDTHKEEEEDYVHYDPRDASISSTGQGLEGSLSGNELSGDTLGSD
ncbi:hypothetical protein BJY01DRAFT_247758 [Aspergillus pseudoustus]|uniref:C2H2-type domain-containing protein n=1 Tax=Aspergillus pseudoustus TaxID=1810923 RepID=A0ABR4JYY5_9EURO